MSSSFPFGKDKDMDFKVLGLIVSLVMLITVGKRPDTGLKYVVYTASLIPTCKFFPDHSL